MDYPESGHCVIFVACKKHPMLFFSVFHLQQRICHLVKSVLAAYHEFRYHPFRVLGFFTKAIRNLLNAVEFVFEFPSFCLCRSSLSCTSIIQCCASIFQWLSLMPRKFLGSRLHRSVAI